jgi:hypothetical protein
VVDPVTLVRTPLVADGTRDLLWPVAVYAKGNIGVFESRLDEANGATEVGSGPNARVTILDLSVLQSLLFQNTRGVGRALGPADYLGVWEDLPPADGVVDFPAGVPNDAFGPLYVRRQFLGEVSIQSDDSAAMNVPGGVPLVFETNFRLTSDGAAKRHSQRESTQYYPGEDLRQGFQRHFFNGLCAGCHGTVSGKEVDGAVNPDILSQASNVAARQASPTNLTGRTGTPSEGPFP